MHYDLIVIGAGIGGCALSITMVRSGSKVLLLEASEVYEDRVRGEWIAPWGVKEVQSLGLYDLLMGAGGHHVATHVSYDETRSAGASEAQPTPLEIFVAGISGPLCIGHPHHCQTLFDGALRSGVSAIRGVQVQSLSAGSAPSVTWTDAQGEHTATGDLLVGADGRSSMVREALGVPLHQDPPHHMFAGLLVDGVEDWDASRQTIGTEGEFNFLTFPQGDGRVRIYGCFPIAQRRMFASQDGPRAFMEAFSTKCAPDHVKISQARPAGPLFSYFNNDAWTDRPYAAGGVLIGDAAGWNDPIIGQGLSITYRDVRIVSDILKQGAVPDFAPYAEERAERLRRLRFTAALTSSLEAEFGPDAAERRRRHHEAALIDPSLRMHAFAAMAGPEMLPPDVFTSEHRARVLGA